jgi:hypothetical protein
MVRADLETSFLPPEVEEGRGTAILVYLLPCYFIHLYLRLHCIHIGCTYGYVSYAMYVCTVGVLRHNVDILEYM